MQCFSSVTTPKLQIGYCELVFLFHLLSYYHLFGALVYMNSRRRLKISLLMWKICVYYMSGIIYSLYYSQGTGKSGLESQPTG